MYYRFPYTEAVLWESQRFQHVVPIAGPRRVTQNTDIDGYLVPEVNIYKTSNIH